MLWLPGISLIDSKLSLSLSSCVSPEIPLSPALQLTCTIIRIDNSKNGINGLLQVSCVFIHATLYCCLKVLVATWHICSLHDHPYYIPTLWCDAMIFWYFAMMHLEYCNLICIIWPPEQEYRQTNTKESDTQTIGKTRCSLVNLFAVILAWWLD